MITFAKLGKYGRLGNQLFQIASTIGIAHTNAMDFTFPKWEYSEHFVNDLPHAIIWDYEVYKEPSSNYNDVKLNKGFNWSLEGYFQSWKYFHSVRDIVKYYLEPDFVTTNKYRDFVSIHIRRGDYIGSSFHINLRHNYYRDAMNLFPNSNFLVFSDDIDFAMNCGWFSHDKCIFKESDHSKGINTNTPEDLLHLMYMSKCKAHIIANSSFSWWSAYLSGNQTVAPRQWISTESTNDRLMPEWIII